MVDFSFVVDMLIDKYYSFMGRIAEDVKDINYFHSLNDDISLHFNEDFSNKVPLIRFARKVIVRKRKLKKQNYCIYPKNFVIMIEAIKKFFVILS